MSNRMHDIFMAHEALQCAASTSTGYKFAQHLDGLKKTKTTSLGAGAALLR